MNFQIIILPFMLTMFLIPIGVKILHYLDMLDHPDTRKIHDNPIPSSGGIIFFMTFTASVFYYIEIDSILKAYLLGVSLPVFVGLVDDIKPLSPNSKFLAQIVSAFIFVSLTKIYLTIPWLNVYPILAFIFCVLFMVGITNSINLLDGLDGLAAGVCVIVASTLSLFFYSSPYFFILLILMAVLFGFLRANTFPAMIFMGDCGSYFLGYSLATFSLIGVSEGRLPLWMLLFLFAIPIVDTSIVFVKRIIDKRNIFLPDKFHLHHRIHRLGVSHKNTVFLIYSLQAIFAFIGIVIYFNNYADSIIKIISIFLILLLTAQHLFLIYRDDLKKIKLSGIMFYKNIFRKMPFLKRAYLYYFLILLLGLSFIQIIQSQQLSTVNISTIFISIIIAFLFIIDNNSGRTSNVSMGMIILSALSLVFSNNGVGTNADSMLINYFFGLLILGILFSSAGMFKEHHFFDSPTEYLMVIILLIFSINPFSKQLSHIAIEMILLFLVYKILLQEKFVRRNNLIYILNISVLCLMIFLNL